MIIQDVDRTLEALLKLELGDPLPFDLSFAIPDENFTPVSNARPTLNCYLYDIRENRDLRSTEAVVRRNPDSTYIQEPAPARVRLSYCITAWSPAQPNAGVLDEHMLLGRVLSVLLRYCLLPQSVLVGTLIGQDPQPFTTVILPDLVTNTSEFWTATQGRLRPSLDYSVTVSMTFEEELDGPLVAGIGTIHGVRDAVGDADALFAAGGIVHDDQNPRRPISAAWVRVNETDRTYVTDDQGHFVIERIPRGTYTLAVRAVGFQEGIANLQVPLTTGPTTIQLVRL